MKINKTLTALIAGASLGLSGQAMAAGTVAGADVTNTVSLSYAVSGTQQASESFSVDFKVDHKINFAVESVSAEIIETGTRPGSTVKYTFRVINNGNGFVDFDLDFLDETLNTSLSSVTGTPNDNVQFESVTYFWDENKDGVDNAGAETSQFVDALDFDDSGTANIAHIVVSIDLYELSDTNAGQYNDLDVTDGIHNVSGLVGGLTFTAQAAANENTGVPTSVANGTLGTVYASDDRLTNDTAGVDRVFADSTADNSESVTGGIKISTSQLSVTKTMSVVDDFITADTTKAKAIPGAQIEYTITVENVGTEASSVDGVTGVSYTITDDITGIAAIDETKAIAITETGTNSTADLSTEDADGDLTDGDIKFEFNTPLATGATNTVKFTAFIK